MPPAPDSAVTDHPDRGRYELAVDGEIAFADYRREPGRLVITHVETPIELRGGGVAGRLMAGIVVHVRADGLKIVPRCPYAAAWMKRHPEHGDLLG